MKTLLPIATKIPKELHDWVSAYAASHTVTISFVLRSMIESFQRNQIKKQQSPNARLPTKSCSTNIKQQQQLQPAIIICDTLDKANEELDRQFGAF